MKQLKKAFQLPKAIIQIKGFSHLVKLIKTGGADGDAYIEIAVRW